MKSRKMKTPKGWELWPAGHQPQETRRSPVKAAPQRGDALGSQLGLLACRCRLLPAVEGWWKKARGETRLLDPSQGVTKGECTRHRHFALPRRPPGLHQRHSNRG